MKKPDYRARQTKHTPALAFPRGQAPRLMHGEPRCGAPFGGGTTTSLDAAVTCPKCAELLRAVHC